MFNWCLEFDLTASEREEINRLLSMVSTEKFGLTEMWKLLDKVWDEMGITNHSYTEQKLCEYYQHPVWLMNGIFTEKHIESRQHREAISQWIYEHIYDGKILDYGGGFGTLGRIIAAKMPTIKIHIFEPYPHRIAMEISRPFKNLYFINELEYSEYDCVISLDVLEHTPDPIKELLRMVKLTKSNGFLIIAHHFYPSIKCHLPCTFYLRYSFEEVAKELGLEKIGECRGSHAYIYQKNRSVLINQLKIFRIKIKAKLIDWLTTFNMQCQSVSKYTERQFKLIKKTVKKILVTSK